MVVATILGALIGLILGVTGAGGGILAVPALVMGLHFDMKTATPAALMAVGVAALVGAIDGLHKHQVRYKAAFFMAATGALLSTMGVRLARMLPETLLATCFAGVMLIVAIRMLRQKHRTGRPAGVQDKPCKINPKTGRLCWTRRCTATLAGIGAVTGLFAGMLGVGGGFVIVPALQHFSDIPARSVVSTSLMLIALVSLSAAANSILQGTHIPALGWGFVAAAVIGMIGGRSLTARVSELVMQQAFAIVTLCVAALLLARAWTGPWA